MPRPRIFVSSTYYDLKYIRNNLEIFINNYGFEPILFERGQITYDYQKPLDLSCYKEVKSSQMLILIIGGRYGSASSKPIPKEQEDSFFEWYNSITIDEYLTAIREEIPTYIFIEKHVHDEYYTYLKNKNNPNVKYAHVDNINMFRFIEEIHKQFSNNIICEFEKFEDIENWLKNQWAGLFYEYLTSKKQMSEIGSLSEKISDLGDVSNTLKNYLEKILEVSNSKDAKKIISKEKERLQKIRDSKIKSNILDSPMMKYMHQHTELDENDIFEVFCKTNNLREFLQELGVEKKEMDYVLSEPMAETNFKEYKNMVNSGLDA
jgi:tRNA nucleotidyltransferase/poly(A) polymerase